MRFPGTPSPPPPPARCQAPRFWLPGGGRGGRERALPCYFATGFFFFFVPLARPDARTFLTKPVPHLVSSLPVGSIVVAVLLAQSPIPSTPGKCPLVSQALVGLEVGAGLGEL